MRKTKVCIYCGKKKPLSVRGICFMCGFERMQQAAQQLKAKSGPFYETYKAGMIQYLEKLKKKG